jgi:hypothetical protein
LTKVGSDLQALADAFKQETAAGSALTVQAGASPGWEALLEEFRALGGIADNIVRREGPRGHGIFPIDRTKPVRLHVPPNLLVPTTLAQLRDGQLVPGEAATLNKRERAFFERYQREFSWGAGVFADIFDGQTQWSQLSPKIRQLLLQSGCVDGVHGRFDPPTPELCLQRYLESRRFSYYGTDVVMPMVELVNHDEQARSYVVGDGIGVDGTFHGEVLVRYNGDDCWGRALSYGFCSPGGEAFSFALNYRSDEHRVQIGRNFERTETFNGAPLPVVRVEDDGTIAFSFLLLGHARHPSLPRAVFEHVTRNLPLRRIDELFELLQHYNRAQLYQLMRLCDAEAAPLVTMLRRAALEQLEVLSNHWGSGQL